MTRDPRRQAITNANELIIDYVAACEVLGQRLDLRDFIDGWMAVARSASAREWRGVGKAPLASLLS